MRKEINELVKESINEVDEIEMDSEELLGVIDDDDMDMDMDLDMDMDMDMGMGDDTVELDLTASSDDEVMKVFKKMGPEDEIEVVKTGDGVTLTDGNEEYEIKNVSEGHHKKDETMYEIELDDDMNEMMDDDEQLYEIELDDFEEEEIEENMQRTFQNGRRGSSGTRKGLNKPRAIPNKGLAKTNGIKESRQRQVPSRIIKENKQLKSAVSTYGSEVKKLKSKNEEYKKALTLFREKLNEVAVFNSNLAYTTK